MTNENLDMLLKTNLLLSLFQLNFLLQGDPGLFFQSTFYKNSCIQNIVEIKYFNSTDFFGNSFAML